MACEKNKLEVKFELMLCNAFTATCGWCIAVIVTLWMGTHFVRNLISGYLAGS